MKLRLWLPDGPRAIKDERFWCYSDPLGGKRNACAVALEYGFVIPVNTYKEADHRVSQVVWRSWISTPKLIGTNDTAILPLEVDE